MTPVLAGALAGGGAGAVTALAVWWALNVVAARAGDAHLLRVKRDQVRQ